MKICLVGATHISYNPRLVREADTLTAAGHQVRVVAPVILPRHADQDRYLLKGRGWRFQPFEYVPSSLVSRLRYWRVRGSAKAARLLFRLTGSGQAAAHAYLPGSAALQKLVSAEPADWFVAHAQGALPIAAIAAARYQARLGFDMEDILTLSPGEPRDLIQAIEARYLPETRYVSVPSNVIGRQILEDNPALRLLTLYNVFPLALRKQLVPPSQRSLSPDESLRLHWFGQTIGSGRGLHLAIDALAPLKDRIELHCRGTNWSSSFPEIEEHARRQGVRFVHHDLIHHDDLIESIGAFHVGLALEKPSEPHYELTVTNKLFSYMLAGLAIAATDTSGQREVLERVPEAGFLFDPAAPAALTDGLRSWIENRERLVCAQMASWRAATERYCWDFESKKWLALLEDLV